MQLFSDCKRLLNGIRNLAAGHFNAKLLHGVLELYTVLAALDSVHLHADYLYAVLFKHSRLIKLGAEVKTRLAAEVGQKRVGALLVDYLREPFNV